MMNDFDVVTGPGPDTLPAKMTPVKATREAPLKGNPEVPPAEAPQDMSMTIPLSAPLGRRGSG
jgi:hypothetical protein